MRCHDRDFYQLGKNPRFACVRTLSFRISKIIFSQDFFQLRTESIYVKIQDEKASNNCHFEEIMQDTYYAVQYRTQETQGMVSTYSPYAACGAS